MAQTEGFSFADIGVCFKGAAHELPSALRRAQTLADALEVFGAVLGNRVAEASPVAQSENFGALRRVYARFRRGEPSEAALRPKQVLA